MKIDDLALVFEGNWNSLPGFIWMSPPEDKDSYGLYHLDHRESNIKTICNSMTIINRLSPFEESGDVIKQSFTHFEVGWINAVAVRVRNSEGDFTDAFKELHKIMNELTDRDILDLEEYQKMVKVVTIGNIEYMAKEKDLVDELPSAWSDKIYNWFVANNCKAIENSEDRGGWPTNEELELCLAELGYLDLCVDDDERPDDLMEENDLDA